MGYGDEDDELNCTLWVGNLDPQITESALFDIFVQGGPIQKIHIPKGKDGNGHKGYCFITFQHNESVPYTMNVLDGTWLCGKLLKLQPRPGSKHKKLMDSVNEGEQRLLGHGQPGPQLRVPVPVVTTSPQLVHGQQQWFLAPPPPQMTQFPNMVVYPNQMFQAYSSCVPNLNNGMASTLIQLPSGMTQIIPFPLQSQPVPAQPLTQELLPPPQPQQQYNGYAQSPRGLRPSLDFRHPRSPRPPVANGYSHPHPLPANGGNNAQLPSQYTQSQVLNGSHSQSVRFTPQQPSGRGPRPQGQRPQLQNTQGNRRNSNTDNGNCAIRPPFSHRSQAQPPPTFQTSPPLIYTTPVYRHQSSPTSLQYHGQPLAQADRQMYQRPPFPPQGDLYTY